MDAITLLKQQEVEPLLEHLQFSEINSEGAYIRSCCKIHGGDNPTAFVFNKDNGLWWCHTGNCGGGDIFSLVSKMKNINFRESVDWLASFYQVNIDGMVIIEKRASYLKDIQDFISMMQRKRKIKEMPEVIITDEIKKLSNFKEFKKETIDFFDLGFLPEIELETIKGKKYKLYNRLLFPILYNNKQVAYSLRRTRITDKPKWSHQPNGVDMGSLLYNYDTVKDKNEIIISEGITDVWAWREVGLDAVATFGANMTNQQHRLLLKTGADLVLAYDGDNAGQIATQKAIDLLKNKANIKIITFLPHQDPENIPREELLDYYNKSKKLL